MFNHNLIQHLSARAIKADNQYFYEFYIYGLQVTSFVDFNFSRVIIIVPDCDR